MEPCHNEKDVHQKDSFSQVNEGSCSASNLLDISVQFSDIKNEVDEQQIDNQLNKANGETTTLSGLECIIREKDIEIEKLIKLCSKHERQIEKTNKYNDDLRHELQVLSSELHKYRTSDKCEMKSVCIQVTDADIEDAYGNKPMPDWGTDGDQGLGVLSIADSIKAAAEAELQNQLHDATTYSQPESEEHKSEAASEYVFDESSGLYYHSATGFYWDPNFGLFYDYTTGTYYQHNETTGEYEVHSQVEMTDQTQIAQGDNIKKKLRRHRSRTKEEKLEENKREKLKRGKSLKIKHAHKIRKQQTNSQEVTADINLDKNHTVLMTKQQEDINIQDSEKEHKEDKILGDQTNENESESSEGLIISDSESSSESGELSSDSSSCSIEEIETEHPAATCESIPEMAEEYPPCIRVIVQSSEHLKCGSLYIITCAGGCVGRDKNTGHAIIIDDISVSKLHAEITFDYEECCYMLKDKGSQNGTILNGVRISENKCKSDCCKLHHDDLLQIGSTTFLLHIHKGLETCDECEPGQVQAKIKAENTVKNVYTVMSQEEKNKQRIRELKNIKKKYGLQNSYYENPGSVVTNPEYKDKAYLRRKLVGSESEQSKQNIRPSSVQSPISTQNKGHQLLAKMGWKEGEGLGKNSSGISEPITVEMRISKTAGLGSSTDGTLSLDNVQHAQKAMRWSQARKRYDKLKDSSNTHTTISDQMLPASSVEGLHSQHLLIPSEEQNIAGLLTAADCQSAHSSSLSTKTDNSSTPAMKSLSISRIQPNCLKDSKVPFQSLQTQKESARTWVSGGTIQIGQLVHPESSYTEDSEPT